MIRWLVFVALLGLLGGCLMRRPPEPTRPKDDLTFKTVNLQQMDDKGHLLWQLDAPRVAYRRFQGEAEVERPRGMLYRNGQLVYELSAQRGRVKGAGAQIFLEGNVVLREVNAKGGQAQLRAGTVVWLPSMQVIQLLGGLRGTYQGGSFTAAGGRFSSKIEQVDLVGPIVGLWPKEQVQFKTLRLTWILPTQKVIGPTPVEAIQQTPDGPRQAQGNRLDGDLKTRVLLLRENARLTSTEPKLIITAPQFAWNTVAAIVTSDRPLTIQYLPEKLTLTAQQGVANLRSRSIQLLGQAKAVAPQGSLRGDRMTWLQRTGAVEVLGNVVYEQRQPYSRTQGQQAIGNLLTRSVVVQGGRVSSLVIPTPRR